MKRLRTKNPNTQKYWDKTSKSGEHVWAFWLDDMYELLKEHGMVYLTVANGGSNIVAVCNIK